MLQTGLVLNSLEASGIQKTWIQVQVQVKLMTWGKSVPFPALLFSSVKCVVPVKMAGKGSCVGVI